MKCQASNFLSFGPGVTILDTNVVVFEDGLYTNAESVCIGSGVVPHLGETYLPALDTLENWETSLDGTALLRWCEDLWYFDCVLQINNQSHYKHFRSNDRFCYPCSAHLKLYFVL